MEPSPPPKLSRQLSTDASRLHPGRELPHFSLCRITFIGLLAVLNYLVYYFQPPHASLSKHFAICSSQGSIYTAEANEPFVECVVINNGLITFVGKREAVQGFSDHPGWTRLVGSRWLHLLKWTEPLQIVSLPGQVSVLPGLIDAHAHPLERGEAKLGVDLLGCTATRCVLERLIDHIRSHPDLPPDFIIRGDGWDQTLFDGQRFPTAADLSSHPLLQERRIVLRRVDFHAYWVSKAVLDVVLSSDQVRDVEGGEIVRNEAGRPTGVFLDNAMGLINRILPNRTHEDRLAFLKSTAREMLSVGLTSVHDAAVDLETVQFYKELDLGDKLPVRVSAMIDCGYTYCGNQVSRYEGPKLCVRSVKLFIDGALGSWGAALWSPYNDRPHSRGILRSPVETILPLIQRWVAEGFQVNSHAIGDRANTIVLDAYEHVLDQLDGTGSNVPRLRIEHAQILRPADIQRMGRLGIIASVQPTHAVADMDFAEARLGPERARGAYAWNSLLRSNVTLALGSDFPVSPVSPFLGIHAAFTRRKPILKFEPSENPAWHPDERIERMQEIIDGFTSRASFASFSEHKVGSLAVGKRADLIIIDRNLFDSRSSRDQIAEDILQVKVLTTILDGNVVFGRI